jgi:hypothetical protein
MPHELTANLVAEAFKEAGFLTQFITPRDMHGHTMDSNYTKLRVQKDSSAMKHMDIYETRVVIIDKGFYQCDINLYEPGSLNKIIRIATEELVRIAEVQNHVQNFTI